MNLLETNLLIGKQTIVAGWGFIGHFTADGRHWEGRRTAPRGWVEVWRTCDPDCISLYKNDDTERSADEIFHIDWSLHSVGTLGL